MTTRSILFLLLPFLSLVISRSAAGYRVPVARHISPSAPQKEDALLEGRMQTQLLNRQDGGNLSTSILPSTMSSVEPSGDDTQPISQQTSQINSRSPSTREPASTDSPASSPAPTDASIPGPPMTTTNPVNGGGSPSLPTSALPPVVTSSGGVDVPPSNPPVVPTTWHHTTTDAQGSTFVTTITPSGRLVTTTVVSTRTNAAGQPEAVTSVEVIEVTDAGPNPTNVEETSTLAGATRTAEPSLQTAAACSIYHRPGLFEPAVIFAAAAGLVACS